LEFAKIFDFEIADFGLSGVNDTADFGLSGVNDTAEAEKDP
jgi:hypothetical protein